MLIDPVGLTEKILANPAPILFFDTCSILDIVRASYRKSVATREISSASHLIKMASGNAPKVWLSTNETVYEEWHANISAVKLELCNEIERADFARSRFISTANLLHGASYDIGQDIRSLDLPNHLESLSENFLSACWKVKIQDTHSIKAMHRIRKYLAPARRGKFEPKDCEIFESFLDVASRIRAKGITENICFITANRDDYGEPLSQKEPIAKDLADVEAKYLNSLSWALAVAQGRASA